jgi:amino acid adenylation domain-containing protein/non-ribosomal peptide synthase protein (TIGR01720 family)
VREVPARFDLTLYAAEVDGAMLLELEHNADLFDRTTAARLLERLRTLLEGAAAGPEADIADLPLLPAAERELLRAWSGGEAAFRSHLPLHVLFEEQARRTPDAVAVVAGEERVTYAELRSRARRVAAHLRRLGVGPEVTVALRLERGVGMIAAILGVLEAGGAYVPLEPALPEERLDFILKDSGARVLLRDSDLAQATLAEEGEPAAVDASNTAYVIYTSGSTGRPKGVAVTHANVVRLFEATRAWFGFGADDVWTLFHSYAFDFSVWEIWGALLYGGRLVVVPYLGSRSPETVARLLESEGVTVLNQTPSAFYQLVAFEETSGRPVGPELRWVIFGGEALDAARLASWIGRHGVDRPRLINMYGITETTVHVTFRPVGEESWHGASAIGRAIPDLGIHMLDREGRPCPVGVPGELHVSGAGLARGYVGRPELTAERFIPDPFGEEGARLYRTGDLARWRGDGELEYLGRIDHQVKIRGFRIELGEIEAILREHPAVRDAVVVAREDCPGDRRLAAYLVEREPAGEEELRQWLRRRLPDYMLPAALVTVEALPLTATGKVDRRSLPAPEARAAGRESLPPRTSVEERLAAVWQEVLGSGPVGAHDNFFALGGDSILVLQVISRAGREGLRITPRQMFEHQTLAELAAVASEAGLPAAEQGPVTGPVPLTPIQRWLFERDLPDVHHFNQAVLLRARGRLDPAALGRALAAVLQHHDALRLRFTRGAEGWRQACAAPGGPVPLSWHDLSGLPEAERAGALERIAFELQGSLDLERGPLFRSAVLDLGEEEGSRLLLIAHHLVVDGVSWRVLLEDLAGAYLGLPLPPKTTSYRAWAERMAERCGSDPEAPEPGLRLPVDLPGGANTEGLAETVSVLLEPEETRTLLQEAAAALRAGVEDLLLTALGRALQPWLGDGRLRIDLEGHGRDELSDGLELSRTVGWFTAIRPVWIELGGGAGPLARERRPAPGLPAEVSFNYLGRFDQVLPAGSPFEPAPEPAGPVRAPAQVRSHLLEVAAGVRGGRLEVAWTFSRGLHRRATVESLARGFLAELRELIALGRSALATLAEPPEDLYPLSPLQEGFLFHALLDPGSQAYFEQVSCALGPDLDAGAFERAWQRVVDRHPVLRTAFVWEGLERPLQAVQRQVRLPWRVVDGQGDLDELLRRDREAGFDLGRAPLLRVTLVRLPEGGHRFVWSYHHLLLDGWCLPLLLREVFELYEAFRRGEEALLPEPRPYRDYIAWLERQDLAPAKAFWREALAGFRSPTPLGVDRPAGSAGTSAERVRSLPVEPLQAAARRLQVTLNALVQAAWALLLGTYSGEREVLFGITVSGRPAELPGAESMIGLFINTLPLRVPLPAAAEIAPWLRRLLARQAEAQRFEHTPLARVQEWSEVPRGVPLFETCVVFENYPLDRGLASAGAGVGLSDVRFFDRSHYPLTLYVEPGEALRLRLAYLEERLDAATVERALGHLEALLDGIAGAGPVSLLRGAERHQVMAEWADTDTAFPAAGLLEAFADNVRERPGDVAVACARENLSYRELDERSDRLARRLRAAGAGPGGIVALVDERGSAFLAAMLAIFKAGAVYLPIDPTLPDLRRERVLADSGARLVLSCADLERLPEGGGEPALPGPDDLAYVLYTSGSTGTPKGAMIEHRGMVNHLRAKIADLGLGADDVVAQIAPQAFDISVWQFLVALVTGGRVEVFDEETVHDPARFLDRLERSGVTIAEVVPSFLAVLLEEAESRGPQRPALSRLRWMIPTGEALPPVLCRRWLDLYPDVPLLNAYGPTECSDDVTHAPIRRAPDGNRVTIGRAVPNLRVRVLGPGLDLLPLSVPGEVCVAGEGVGRGYLGDPARTAEAFVPDPFPRRPGERLYRTGDLGRLLPDGSLELLGRIDHQVKVRGHRVELGDVEAALSRVPGVRQAAATVREDRPGERRLVAYMAGELPAPGELRERLLRYLPEPMVPTVFVELPALPLTANGKVDRKALPAPDASAPREREAPREEVERLLARIWSEVLGVGEAGIHDDFFELGGDSILSIQIVSRANRAGLRLTPRDLFDHPTVAELAAAAGRAASVSAEQGPVTGPVPLVPVQRWFFEQGFADLHHWNMALMLELRRPVPAAALARAVGMLLEHHDALRLRYACGPEGWEQSSAPPGGEPPFSVADLSALPDSAVEALAADVHASLDLERGPLLRAVLIQLGPERPSRLLLAVHHLAVDVVSWRVLMEDLETACAGAAVLPPKTLSFQGWAERLLQYAASPDVRAELPYWLEQGRPLAAPVPVDGPGPNTVASTRIASLRLQPEETRALLQEVPRRFGARTEDVLLAAVAQAVAAWTGGSAARIWLESHGREELFEEVDLTRTAGWFTCEYPVLLEPGAGARPEEAVEAVHRQLQAVPRGGIGYGLLRYSGASPDAARSLAGLPQAEVLFNYVGQLDRLFAEDSPFAVANESVGPVLSPHGLRTHLLEVNGAVVEGRLELIVLYSANLHRPETVERLVADVAARLRAVLGSGGPAIFSRANLTRQELDDVLAELDEVMG